MKRGSQALAASLAALALALALGETRIANNFSLTALDARFASMADPARVDKNIVLIEVDQDSLDHFENQSVAWPWPRTMYNPIIEYATAAGAKAILFDILFTNLAPYGYDVDLEFADAIKRAGAWAWPPPLDLAQKMWGWISPGFPWLSKAPRRPR